MEMTGADFLSKGVARRETGPYIVKMDSEGTPMFSLPSTPYPQCPSGEAGLMEQGRGSAGGRPVSVSPPARRPPGPHLQGQLPRRKCEQLNDRSGLGMGFGVWERGGLGEGRVGRLGVRGGGGDLFSRFLVMVTFDKS